MISAKYSENCPFEFDLDFIHFHVKSLITLMVVIKAFGPRNFSLGNPGRNEEKQIFITI
jgi:hypothetical protein